MKPPQLAATARLQLWELDVECHSPLVGSCWTAAELRRLTDRLFGGSSRLDDFALHAAVVAQCTTRNKLSLGLQRVLDQRAAEALRRIAAAPGVAAREALWREALQGGDVGAALWALWTDAQIDDALRRRIHQDLYLLQHQRVATLRADAAERAAWRAEQQALQDELRRVQDRQARWRSEALAERDALQTQRRSCGSACWRSRRRSSGCAGPHRPSPLPGATSCCSALPSCRESWLRSDPWMRPRAAQRSQTRP